jgi:hypothetical protein
LLYDILDVIESVAYFALRMHSKRVFVSLSNDKQLSIPNHVFPDVKLAHATSSAVVIVLFDQASQSFEGYAIVESFKPFPPDMPTGVVPVQATLLRRACVKFSQVMHIRDDQGLRGRPLSAVRDGSRLGISAGRVLCRLLDKKAYSEDSVHYRDIVDFTPNLVTGVTPSVRIPPGPETDLLTMDFSQYLEEFARRRSTGEMVPSLDSIVYR